MECLVTVMIANTGFMGYPVTLGIFGQEGFLRAIFCDIATSFIFLVLSFVLILKFGGTVKTAVRKIAFFPPLWAVVLGLIFTQVLSVQLAVLQMDTPCHQRPS